MGAVVPLAFTAQPAGCWRGLGACVLAGDAAAASCGVPSRSAPSLSLGLFVDSVPMCSFSFVGYSRVPSERRVQPPRGRHLSGVALLPPRGFRLGEGPRKNWAQGPPCGRPADHVLGPRCAGWGGSPRYRGPASVFIFQKKKKKTKPFRRLFFLALRLERNLGMLCLRKKSVCNVSGDPHSFLSMIYEEMVLKLSWRYIPEAMLL